MEKKILIIQNVTRERPGFLLDVIEGGGCSCECVDLQKGDTIPDFNAYDGMVMLGGQDSANDTTPKVLKAYLAMEEWLKTGKPYLGICLGMQLLVKAAGGRVTQSPVKEVGYRDHEGHFHTVYLTEEGKRDPLFEGLDDVLEVFHMHEDTVDLTEDMVPLASGKHVAHQAVRVGSNCYGVQGHFEMNRELLDIWRHEFDDLKALDQERLMEDYHELEEKNTMCGSKIFKNFLTIVETYEPVRV